MIVQQGKVISILFSLRADQDNKLIASRQHKPLEFLVGKKKLILGLDKELIGLSIGDTKKVKIPPEKGYGLRDESRVRSLQRSQISDHIELHQGMTLKRKMKSGTIVTGIVKSFDEEQVVVDFNHPLAGETLNFETEIIDIRDATAEETQDGYKEPSE
ncbi:MAG: peptidylprolyl isomerase [Calditrichaeota bacterium]|nr:MAG: peptidylprolyl isomerase [Calditrichota bacterium]